MKRTNKGLKSKLYYEKVSSVCVTKLSVIKMWGYVFGALLVGLKVGHHLGIIINKYI